MAVPAVHGIAIQNEQWNIRGLECFAKLEYSAGRLLTAPVAEVNDAIGMHFFCQFYDHVCFFFVWTVIEIV